MIARAAQWDGEPEKLAETLIRAGWIDENEDGALEIHDWYEYAGKLIDQTAGRERTVGPPAVLGPVAASSSDDTQDDPDADRRTTAGRHANDRRQE